MLEKVKQIMQKYESLKEKLYSPDIISDIKKVTDINKQLLQMQTVYELCQKYINLVENIKEAKSIIDSQNDEEMIYLAKQQLKESEELLPEIENKIKIELLPKDPNDDKNIFLEIRPAAGGDEAGLFAAELFRAYMLYAQNQGWKVEIIDTDYTDIGGLKFGMLKISGEKVYSKLKFESGVHRVQRVPETESKGRVHTSTITVAIMPEVEDIQIQIDPNDVVMDTYGASSAGGQNANKNQTGVRLHHKPTGIIVDIGDSKSQLQNKEKAWAVLRAKLYQLEKEKQQSEERAQRLSQIGTGDRSEKIRTYNFPQDRITDHRIKHGRKDWSNIQGFMSGEMDDIINELIVENQINMMQNSQEI